ncbi:MAG: DUF3883 domain-containing protein [Solirubrobacterales bacterium]
MESYWHKATSGIFSPYDLRVGEELLIDIGLLFEHDRRLYLTPRLSAMLDGSEEDAIADIVSESIALMTDPLTPEASAGLAELVPDARKREELLIVAGQRYDDARKKLIGDIGEEIVVAAARAELRDLGHHHLARAVRRVSLESDALGFDVLAPRVAGNPRLFEVKATTRRRDEVLVHLSRNEASVGQELLHDWALVLCFVDDLSARTGEVAGWCPAATISPRLPTDSPGGRWESAGVSLGLGELIIGLPMASA